MDDKELVEAWQNEFWSLVEKSPDSIKNSEFNQIRLEGFLLAKRSQPAITVPAYDMHHFAPVRNLMAKMDSAGIKYTVGE